MTSHVFIPPPAQFGRDVVIISYRARSFGLIAISGARLGVASKKNFPWLGPWVVERESRDKTRIRLTTRVRSTTNSEHLVRLFGSIQFGEEESSIPVSSSAALGLRRWRASSVGSFSRSVRSKLVIGTEMHDMCSGRRSNAK